MTQTTKLENCPFCGAMLPESNHSDTLLNNLYRLKQEGVLEHTLFVAVSIVKTMNDNNPAWLKELFQDHIDNVRQYMAELMDSEDRESKKTGNEVKESYQKAIDEVKQCNQHIINEVKESNQKTMDKVNESNQKALDKVKESERKIIEQIAEILGNPQLLGKIQEISIAKRLSAMKIGNDAFSVSNSNRSLEDVECTVIEKNIPYGKILIESKKTKKWSSDYLAQLQGYMKKQSTEFGILATQTLPDDALNDTLWKDGVLIVKPENIEPAYVYLRQFLIMKKELRMKYDQKMSTLEVKDMVVQELQNSIKSGELDALIERINKSTGKIDDELIKAEKYMDKHIRALRMETKRIRECTTDLMSNHVEKIRMQLMDQINETYLPSIEVQ